MSNVNSLDMVEVCAHNSGNRPVTDRPAGNGNFVSHRRRGFTERGSLRDLFDTTDMNKPLPSDGEYLTRLDRNTWCFQVGKFGRRCFHPEGSDERVTPLFTCRPLRRAVADRNPSP
jgi:hypothetical protein